MLQTAKPLVKQIAAPALAAMVAQTTRRSSLGSIRVRVDALLEIQRRSGGHGESPERIRRSRRVSPQRRLLRCLLFAPRLAATVDRAVWSGADVGRAGDTRAG